MVIFNEKDGKGNELWQKALAEATSGEEFRDTRAAVLKMMADAKALRRGPSMRRKEKPHEKPEK
jgi:hypothetical protein